MQFFFGRPGREVTVLNFFIKPICESQSNLRTNETAYSWERERQRQLTSGSTSQQQKSLLGLKRGLGPVIIQGGVECPQSQERELPFAEVFTRPVETKTSTFRFWHCHITTFFLLLSLTSQPHWTGNFSWRFLSKALQNSRLQTCHCCSLKSTQLIFHCPVFAIVDMINYNNNGLHVNKSSQCIYLLSFIISFETSYKNVA